MLSFLSTPLKSFSSTQRVAKNSIHVRTEMVLKKIQELLIGSMDRRRRWLSILLLFPCFFFSGQSSSNISTTDILDSVIRNYAFQALERHRTGIVYNISLPANLSSMTASALRMRSSSLWKKGTNFTAFRIPSGTTTIPFVKRLVVVYQSWGNWSTSYYNITGYKLIGPVIGLLAYDASDASSSNTTELDFKVTESAISISFSKVTLPKGSNYTAKCARFDPNGTIHHSDLAPLNMCMTMSTGHFAIIVPLEDTDYSSVMEKGKKWWICVAIAGSGVVGLVLVSLIVTVMFKMAKKRKREKMAKRAEEGETLDVIWIGKSRMPSAAMIRTQPILENGSVP